MPYHLRISLPTSLDNEYKLDLEREDLESIFVEPYSLGEPFFINGKTVNPYDIEEVHINETEEKAELCLKAIRKKRQQDSIKSGVPDEWYLSEIGDDVTDEFIKGPVGHLKNEVKIKKETQNTDNKKVFVVHGRDGKIRDSMFSFLRAIGLKPIEWSQAVSSTGEGSPYIGEILENAFLEAQAVVVLLTPDDIAYLREDLQKSDDADHEKKPTLQARQNVLFEAGMAFGKYDKRTILVEIGKIRPFSDIGGRHVIKMDDSSNRRNDLVQRLKTAGCNVDIVDGSWLREGDFTCPELDQSILTSATGSIFTPDEDCKKILLLLGRWEGERTSVDQLAYNSKLSHVRIKYYLDSLKDNEFIELSSSFDGTALYNLAPNGRKFLIDNDLID